MPPAVKKLDENLLTWATPNQDRILRAVNELGSYAAAAESLGMDPSNISAAMTRLKSKAATRGYHPDVSDTQAPEGYYVKGKSTLVDGDGNTKLVWTKTNADDKERLEAMLAAIEEVASEKRPIPKIIAPKAAPLKDLCTLYTITDYHVGMYAWAAETGEDWDMSIAQTVFRRAMQKMISGSPDSETGILNIQGDFLHWDGMLAVTPASKHVLDADTRFPKLVQVSLEMVIDAVGLLLQKHRKVKVFIVEGNHDESSSAWLRAALVQLYKKNPRCEIDDEVAPFYAHQHGKIMIGIHHGHKVKNKDLPAFFASDPKFRKIWGACEYAYIHTGHYHHVEKDQDEMGGAVVERHPTLAARDAYAARHGYLAWRKARAITYHSEEGEYCTFSVSPEKQRYAA